MRRREVDWRGVSDWAPVVGVAAISQTGLGLEQSWTGSDLALALTGVMLAVPLVLCRTRPVVAAGLLAAVLPTQIVLGGSLHFGTFLAVLVAAYSLGYRATALRRAALGVLLLMGGIVVAMRESLPEDAAELVFPLFYVTASAGVGAFVRRLARQSAELSRLNDVLARERDVSARLAVATERMRLARDLHDVVAHTLTVAVVQAEKAEDSLDHHAEDVRSALRAIQEAGRHGLADLRSMVRVLRDADSRGTEPDLADLEALAGVLAGAGLQVDVVRTGETAVGGPLGRDLFRVAQEALTNVVRHSAARHARVQLSGFDDRFELTVTDEGPGLGSIEASGGHGVAGMGERLAVHGGSVEAAPQGRGFRVHATVPMEPVR